MRWHGDNGCGIHRRCVTLKLIKTLYKDDAHLTMYMFTQVNTAWELQSKEIKHDTYNCSNFGKFRNALECMLCISFLNKYLKERKKHENVIASYKHPTCIRQVQNSIFYF